MAGETKVQRACTPCVAYAQRGPLVKKKMAQLSGRIFSLSGNHTPLVEPKNLEEAVVLCETALMSFEEAHSAAKQRVEMAEAEVVMEQQARQQLASEVFQARDFIYQLGEKLHGMHGGTVPSTGSPSEMDLEEAMAFCESALGPLKQVLATLRTNEDAKSSRCSTPRLGGPYSTSVAVSMPLMGVLSNWRSQKLHMRKFNEHSLIRRSRIQGLIPMCAYIKLYGRRMDRIAAFATPSLESGTSRGDIIAVFVENAFAQAVRRIPLLWRV
jgi:hypothetical protein